MKGMILAAGYGIRLRPETDRLPKPLFSIGTTNMIRNSIGYLTHYGIKDIAINIHHLRHLILKELSWGVRDKVTLHIVEEEEIMGTAGGIKGAESFLAGSTFAVINSDILHDINLDEMLKIHESNSAVATLALRDNPNPGKIGTLAADTNGRLARFLDTTMPGYKAGNVEPKQKMFTGVAIFSAEIFDYIPAGRRVDISTEVYPKLVETGKPIYTYNHTGYWADIGTPKTYSDVRMDVALSRFKTYSIK